MLLAVNVRNIGNDISRVNTFYIGPYRHTGSTDSGIGRVCYCWITLHIERYALSLKFANRTVPVLTISKIYNYLSLTSMQTSKVGDTSVVYTIYLSKHSLPVWFSISNSKRKFYRAILEDKRKKSGYGGIMPGIVFDSATTISELSTFLSLLLSPFNLTFMHLKKKHFNNY